MPAPKITRLRFHAGPNPGEPGRDIHLDSITLIVGPNNSGKSLALKEIESWSMGEDHQRVVLADIQVHGGGQLAELEALMEPFKGSTPQGQVLPPGTSRYTRGQFQGRTHYDLNLNLNDLVANLAAQGPPSSYVRRHFIGLFSARLDGKTRFNLASDQPAAALSEPTTNHLHGLLKDPGARKSVRDLAFPPFGEYFTVDPTGMTTLKMKMNPKGPETEDEEAGIATKSINYHKKGRSISEYSDGVQAFLGLSSAVMALPCTILMIDEPEAFLHPPLARRLGEALSALARERAASLTVSTHSPSFLTGCLDSGGTVGVIRVTYEGRKATTRVLPAAELRRITRDPLLRSTRALDALFHRAAIVTESEADRAFYDEVNQRLLRKDRGIQEALFLHAQNKQTIHRIVDPLRKLGIPAPAVVDLDFLRDTGTNWSNLTTACQIPDDENDECRRLRDLVKQDFAEVDLPDALKSQGRTALKDQANLRFHELSTRLANYGLFVVESGELENWLPQFSIPRGDKTRWLIKTFDAMGADPDDTAYLQPGKGDVWTFIDRIGQWAANPERLGTRISF